jgi:hypothetical protein
MKKYILLYLVLFCLSCKTTSGLKYKDLSKLNGKWEDACFEPFDNPSEIECWEFLTYKQISIDLDSGIGEEIPIDDYMGMMEKKTIKIFKKGKKLMLTYYLPSGEEEFTAEIIKLDEKELKLKVKEKRYYLISERALR